MELNDLRYATFHALCLYGLGMLRDPHRFVALVTDTMDSDSQLTNLLHYHCEAEYLELFAKASEFGTEAALQEAVIYATAWLINRMIREEVAQDTSTSIGMGIADYLKLRSDSDPNEIPHIHCISCGTVLPKSANYCSECGKPVLRESEQPHPPTLSFLLTEDELNERLAKLRDDDDKKGRVEPPSDFACCYSPGPSDWSPGPSDWSEHVNWDDMELF